MKKRAYISVFDKTNIEDLAKRLEALDYEIVSTGGTFKYLKDKGINPIESSTITGFTELLGGKVKSLHPKIFAGILANENEASELEYPPFSIVVVNLYPFESYKGKKVELETLLQNIDIGGVGLIRAAAKNFQNVVVLSDPSDYGIDFENVLYVDKSFEREEKLVRPGDILISLANSLDLVGRVTYVDQAYKHFSFGAFMGVIRVDRNKRNPAYIFNILQSQKAKKYFKSVAKTTTNISNLTFEDLGEFVFPLPSIEKQNEIVSEISCYRNIIKGAREVISNYKPVFLINPEWEIKALSEICTFEYGFTDTATSDGDTRYIRITDINSDGTISGENAKYINITEDNIKYCLNKDDVLVARIGATFGKTAIFDSKEPSIFASYLIRLTFNETVLPKYFFYYAQSDNYWKQARDLVTGAGQPQFNANTIKLIRIPIPSIEEQQRIISQIEEEKSLIAPSKRLVIVFENKIKERINNVWGE